MHYLDYPNLIPVSIGVIIFNIIVGAILIYNYFSTNEINREIATWPTTPGKILNTEYFPGSPRSSAYIKVRYEFYIDGKRYESDNIYTRHDRYGVGGPDEVNNLDFIKNPSVKYNPSAPDESCLILYPSKRVVTILMIVGIGLSLVGWLGLLFRFIS